MDASELIAKNEIQTLISQYCQLLDDLRLEELGELFCRDGAWIADTHRFVGRRAIIEGLRALEPAKPGMVRHLSFSPIMAFHGAEARSWTDNIALVMGDGGPQVVSSRRYRDVFRREDGRWRFYQRVSVHPGPIPD